MSLLLLALRWALGIVWMAAGASKAGESSSVSESIRNYAVLPIGFVNPLARILPTAEIVLGFALAAGVLPVTSGWLAFGAFLALAGAMTWSLARGRTFDCGCGLMTDTDISWKLVARNVVLAIISAAIALGPSGRLAALPGSSSAPANGTGASVLVAIPMIVLLVAFGARLLASLKPSQTLAPSSPARALRHMLDQGIFLLPARGHDTPDEGAN